MWLYILHNYAIECIEMFITVSVFLFLLGESRVDLKSSACLVKQPLITTADSYSVVAKKILGILIIGLRLRVSKLKKKKIF